MKRPLIRREVFLVTVLAALVPPMQRVSILVALLSVSHGCGLQPVTSREPLPSSGFALDPSRPYLEIVFERAGPRVPVMPGESSEGVWLRFRNNCPYRVQLRAMSAEHKNDGEIIQFDVIDLTPADRVFGGPQAGEEKPPTGYRQFSHTPLVVEVPSGGDVVFSVPKESFTFDTVIRVEALIKLPVFALKEAP
jgi:hypothetical protein